ncbi:glycerophosphodiester phosphodiesterase (plasmid) [Bacillus sp. 31A1R]|uniref:Glycerophosphodiester phosphodiesterase n=1 Tax=Robertmurraya mangrovi TaxID=3098077 RepID=A0ABU5IV96_9BACI|nr:glycerophosphodiester phosphodiesterase [Bacillus sp. 31A1R]MDZ5471071.1 glycerophosphodiester phosphodiesterase [Bacillus sp. 31A1R]
MTLIFAHRGYSSAFPENTMRAFMEAEKAGAEGLEIDVQLTKDGEVVVIHDEKVDRTTGSTGYVKDFTFKELRKLDASYLHKTLLKKEPIPSLEELFEWMSTTNLVCNVELKNIIFRYEGMEEKIIELVRKYNLADRIILSSFNHYSIIYSYRIDPEVEIAPLLAEGLYMPWVYASSIQAKGIHPKYIAATNEMVKSCMENGIAVRPYTVNKKADMLRFFEVGCSAFITDDPVKALRIRKQFERKSKK